MNYKQSDTFTINQTEYRVTSIDYFAGTAHYGVLFKEPTGTEEHEYKWSTGWIPVLLLTT